MLMYTLGRNFIPPSIHAGGGLRYHGDSPLVPSYITKVSSKRSRFRSVPPSKRESFSPARGNYPRARKQPRDSRRYRRSSRMHRTGQTKTIYFTLSGHGHFDMAAYDRYFAGQLEDYCLP